MPKKFDFKWKIILCYHYLQKKNVNTNKTLHVLWTLPKNNNKIGKKNPKDKVLLISISCNKDHN